MITVTRQKPLEEIKTILQDRKKVFIVACETGATKCLSGEKIEVRHLSDHLKQMGKVVTGSQVIPSVCDDFKKEAITKNGEAVSAADCILGMTCAFGLHTISKFTEKPVYPAFNTLFVGYEERPGYFIEICMQCGDCIIASTAGLCPVTMCAKNMLNGPCGGSRKGKCEVSADIPCVWQMIYDKLAERGELHKLDEILPPKNWSCSQSGGPRRTLISVY